MEIKKVLLTELAKAKKLPYVPQETINLFDRFIRSGEGLLRSNNIPHHVCSFFLPIHIPTRSIYLVHHIKAQDWIPPGGHIDPDETPVDTVKREFNEELMYKLDKEPIRLTDITIKNIRTKRHPCRTHYDFWYVVPMEKAVPFAYDRNEFYQASWFPLSEGLNRMHLPMYRTSVANSVIPLFA